MHIIWAAFMEQLQTFNSPQTSSAAHHSLKKICRIQKQEIVDKLGHRCVRIEENEKCQSEYEASE